MTKKIAIAGATGFVGTQLTLKLLDLGFSIKAMSRHPENWTIQHAQLEVIKGSMTDEETVKKLLDGCETLYYLVHSLQSHDDDFEYEEALSAVTTLKALQASKCKKIIFLGGLGESKELSRHLRSRQLVGEILGAGKVPCLEFRASIVVGAHSTSFEMIKALSQRLPFKIEMDWLNTLAQPIALQDLLEYLTEAEKITIKGHQIVEIGGPNVMSYADLYQEYLQVAGLQRPKFHLKYIDPKLFIPLIDKMMPEFAEVGKKLFLSLVHSTIVTSQKAYDLFPEIKPVSVKEALISADRDSTTTYPPLWDMDYIKELVLPLLKNDKLQLLNLMELLKRR